MCLNQWCIEYGNKFIGSGYADIKRNLNKRREKTKYFN